MEAVAHITVRGKPAKLPLPPAAPPWLLASVGCVQPRTSEPLSAQVVAAAALAFAWWGCQFSWQFERGQHWDGYAPGLQQGALGRRVVSCTAALRSLPHCAAGAPAPCPTVATLGALQDLSDIQWREFRGGLPAMATLFLSTAAMSRALQSTAASRVARMRFYLLTSLGFLGTLPQSTGCSTGCPACYPPQPPTVMYFAYSS